ncbi:CAP family protein [Qipengyuania vesicularis]|uniref:CAP family protein n=1 Tax=Qipengyuania vesicularis TaxID=2867232 RepID=UPI001C873BB0|nr:CAP family protein [Qipengyuania vesicularis]MBX7526781.1 CAP family protein [Qipengyuania vesicularis]
MLSVMLATHNEARAEVGVPDLVLDNDLNRQALAYAEEMARTGMFQHSKGSDRPGQGENLWAGTASAFPYERMSGAWIDEKRFFIDAEFPNVSTTGNWQDVGHYTQIVWRDTTRFGCGIATGLGRDWLVCRYSPPGNVLGRRVF